MPLEKNSYLRIQCFLNHVESRFDQIRYSVFLHNDCLIWSGLEQEDMRSLYRYFVSNVLPQARPAGVDANVAGFLTGPQDIRNPETPVRAPRVFIEGAQEDMEMYLVVYQSGGANVCFLISGSALMDLPFYRELETFIAPQVKSLAAMVAEQPPQRPSVYACAAPGLPLCLPDRRFALTAAARPTIHDNCNNTRDPSCRYIYFNYVNLALKSTMHFGGVASVQPEIMRMLCGIHEDLYRYCDADAVHGGAAARPRL